MVNISPASAETRADTRADATGDLAPRLRMSVMRLARRLRQLDLAADGVTLSQLSALYVLQSNGPLTIGDLAAAEKVQPPTMTRLVTRLEEDGYVRRVPHPTDRRAVVVEPTAAALRLVDASRSRRTAELERRLGSLTAAERARVADVVDLLDRLAEAEA
jgi:DNA-binding MarR family transcriptional regulator